MKILNIRNISKWNRPGPLQCSAMVSNNLQRYKVSTHGHNVETITSQGLRHTVHTVDIALEEDTRSKNEEARLYGMITYFFARSY